MDAYALMTTSICSTDKHALLVTLVLCLRTAPHSCRYTHYKYNGFGGKGATSSWARNPKMAMLYDH